MRSLANVLDMFLVRSLVMKVSAVYSYDVRASNVFLLFFTEWFFPLSKELTDIANAVDD